MPWLRLWVDILDDPDLDALPDDVALAWFKLLAVAKRNDPQGELPPLRRLPLVLRRPAKKVESWVKQLIAAGFIDVEGETMRMHGWERWQPKEPLTNAERQAKFRASKKVPPLDSPSGEEKRGEEKSNVTPLLPVTPVTSNDPPPPPPTFPIEEEDFAPPPLSDVAKFAEQLMGDVSWAQWADGQVRLGAPEHSIREALEETITAGKISRSYTGQIMRRLKAEGYPRQQPPKKHLSLKGGGGGVNQPAVTDPADLARIKAELAMTPSVSPQEFTRRQQRNAAS